MSKKKTDGLLHLTGNGKRSLCGVKVREQPSPHEMGTWPTCTPCVSVHLGKARALGEAMGLIAKSYAESLNDQIDRISADAANLVDEGDRVSDEIDALNALRQTLIEGNILAADPV